MAQLTHTAPPSPGEYAPFYAGYIAQVTESDIIAAHKQQIIDGRAIFDSVKPDQANVLHEPYTWTIKQVVGHLNDGERIFGYRLNRFACEDPTPLPGFPENDYVDVMDYQSCSLVDLVDEWEHLRRANIAFIQRISPSAWDFLGTANGSATSVRALVYILVGHFRHHANIVKKRIGI